MALVTMTRPILAPDLPFDVKKTLPLWCLPLGRSNVCRVFEHRPLSVHEFFLSVARARVCINMFLLFLLF